MKKGWHLVWSLALMVAACGKDASQENSENVDSPPAANAVSASQTATPTNPETPEVKEVSPTPPEPPKERPQETQEAPATETDGNANEAAADNGNGAPPTPGAPYLLAREGVHITALTLARGIEKNDAGKRMPVDPGHVFPRDDRRVYAIVDLANPELLEAELKVGWIKPGTDTEANPVTLSVKPKETWRTWAFNKYVNKEPGIWQVVFRDAEDTVLARAAFEMQPSSSPDEK